MSFITQSVPIITDGSGVASADVRIGGGRLFAVKVELGTLSTPDIHLTDEPDGVSLLTVAGVAVDTRYNLAALAAKADGTASTTYVPVPVLGRVHVVVSGGGATKTGRLVFLIER